MLAFYMMEHQYRSIQLSSISILLTDSVFLVVFNYNVVKLIILQLHKTQMIGILRLNMRFARSRIRRNM
jgi:hypothetical protein